MYCNTSNTEDRSTLNTSEYHFYHIISFLIYIHVNLHHISTLCDWTLWCSRFFALFIIHLCRSHIWGSPPFKAFPTRKTESSTLQCRVSKFSQLHQVSWKWMCLRMVTWKPWSRRCLKLGHIDWTRAAKWDKDSPKNITVSVRMLIWWLQCHDSKNILWDSWMQEPPKGQEMKILSGVCLWTSSKKINWIN